MKYYLVNVSDKLTIERWSTLIIEADDHYEAEEAALMRCRAIRSNVTWDEEQTDATPYQVEVVRGRHEMAELVDLIIAEKTRPEPLDEVERSRMEHLISKFQVPSEEISRFHPTKD
jgi:hypothetical protein